MQDLRTNLLYFGDNYKVLKEKIPDASIDLVYLDPPFNSNRNYFVIFKDRTGVSSAAQEEAFSDTWRWAEDSVQWYRHLITECPYPTLGITMEALKRIVGESALMAYLVAMAVRLVELHRVLKPTGSLYLHCDPTASHYLKIVLDTIFGATNFRNEIIWKRTSAHSSAKKFAPVHDTLLFYTKSDEYCWNPSYVPISQETIDQWYNNVETGTERRFNRADLTAAGRRTGSSGLAWRGIEPTKKGRHWAIPGFVHDIVSGLDTLDALDALDAAGRLYWPKKSGGVPMIKRYLEEAKGIPALDVFNDIRPLNNVSAERLGYPTQKPLALLDRIVSASSNLGDVVLDPFCGCGTAVHAAHKLGRKWIGIDITTVAVRVIRDRMEKAYPELATIPIDGFPKDLEGAQAFFQEDPHQFQQWACTLIDGFPLTKKGADKGIDGWRTFYDLDGSTHRGVIQVKGGKLTLSQVRDFCRVVEREKSPLGFLLSLETPTHAMRTEALSMGVWKSAGGREYPKVRLLTVAELLTGRVESLYPPQDKVSIIGHKAQRQAKADSQTELDIQ